MTYPNKNYQSRIVSAEEAVRHIKSGDRIFLTGNCSVPQTRSLRWWSTRPTCKMWKSARL